VDIREFQPFGASHWFAIASTAAAGLVMVGIQRSARVPDVWKRRIAATLAVLLVSAVAADPLLCWLRYAPADPAQAARLVHENSWPLYFCDIASLLCALALVWRNRGIAELAYLWGVAGTVQGLITPTLYFDWWTPEYWAFFIQHGGVPVAGVTLACGMGLHPLPGAVRRATAWGIVYLAIAGLGNWLIATAFPGARPNYGFVCEKPPVGSLFDYFGPWPWYLGTLTVIAALCFHLLCLPWHKARMPEPQIEESV
jgi:hypothetical integral membrane protein (TIGR02206 family)